MKRVLIGMDGSSQSFNAALYISEIMPPDQTRVVLFNVDSDIRELYFDISGDQDAGELEETGYVEWVDQRKTHLEIMLEKTMSMFTAKGFPSDRIQAVSRDISIGVARDLIAESRKDYDLIVVGKTGIRGELGGSMGSVTDKLISRVFHIPVVVVEGHPETTKILVGFDDSKGANNAVNGIRSFVGEDMHIMLCHVIRSSAMTGTGEFEMFSSTLESKEYTDFETRRIENQRVKMAAALSDRKEWLIKAGISPEHVDTTILEGHMSRSRALVAKARSEGYGSIVLGRRGHSAVMEFFIGRVGRKVVDMSESVAVWIMN